MDKSLINTNIEQQFTEVVNLIVLVVRVGSRHPAVHPRSETVQYRRPARQIASGAGQRAERLKHLPVELRNRGFGGR